MFSLHQEELSPCQQVPYVLTVMIGIIGPNISSCIIIASCGTSNTIVGAIFLQHRERIEVMILLQIISILRTKMGIQLTISSHHSDLLEQFCQIPHPRASQVV